MDPSHIAVMLGCAMAVTGARQVLLGVWPAFAQATDRSNAQVLQPCCCHVLRQVVERPLPFTAVAVACC